MFIDSTGSADQYSHSDCVCNWDVLKFVIATIAGLGCVAMLGCGTAGYLKIGTFSTLQQIPSLSLMSLGAAGLLASVITPVVLSSNREADASLNREADASFWQRHGKEVDAIPMPQAMQEILSDPKNPYMPVLIPTIRDIKELETIVTQFGLGFTDSLPNDGYRQESLKFLKEDTLHWVLWKKGVAVDWKNWSYLTVLPEGLLTEEGGCRVPTIIEAVICLLAEFSANNNLSACTLSCHELPRLDLYHTSNYLSVEFRNNIINIRIYNRRIESTYTGYQHLIKKI